MNHIIRSHVAELLLEHFHVPGPRWDGSVAWKPGLPPHAPFTSPRCCTSRRRMLTGQWGRQADPHQHDYDIYSSLWGRPDAAAVGLPGYGAAQGTSPGQFYCITADGDKSNLTAPPGGKALGVPERNQAVGAAWAVNRGPAACLLRSGTRLLICNGGDVSASLLSEATGWTFLMVNTLTVV